MIPMPELNWTRQAVVDTVVDGDTVHLTVDEGMHDRRVEVFRVARVNAPEMKTPEGKAAKAWLIDWLVRAVVEDSAWPLIIQTHKTDNWGRYIVEIWRKNDGMNLSDALLDSGVAVPWP